MGIASPAAAAKARGPRKIVAKYEPPARVVTAKKAARKQSLRGIEASQMVCIEASQMVSAAKQGVHGRLRMHGVSLPPLRRTRREDKKGIIGRPQTAAVYDHAGLLLMGCDVVSAGISLTHACKAVMGQRQVFCVWGLRPMFNSSASTSSFDAAGNVRQRQRQRQPQQRVPLVAAALMLACLLLSCCACGE